MTRARPFGRGDDARAALTLDVEDRPRISRGDTLLVTPDVGRPYRATVKAVEEDDRLRVRIPGDGSHPVAPQAPSTRWFDVEELTDFYAMGDLLINPDESRPY